MACKYGIDRKDCLRANRELSRLSIPTLFCRDCFLDQTVIDLLELYLDGVKRERRAVVRWLKRMKFNIGLLDSPPPFKSEFRCPTIREIIAVPCSLEKCRFHIDYPWAANCLLAYLHQQEIESLSADEIAYLYQFPVDHIKAVIDQSIAALRYNALDIQARQEDSLRPRFKYFPTTKVCCVCESEIDQEQPKGLRIDSIGAAYCSKECREEKAPKLVELEASKGLPIEKILDWSFRRYKSLSLAEQALGIPRWLAYESCKRFLKKPIEEYFSSLKSIHHHRKSMLIRRTWHAPRWVNSMIERIRPVSREVASRYGPTKIQTSDLKDQLNHLLQNL